MAARAAVTGSRARGRSEPEESFSLRRWQLARGSNATVEQERSADRQEGRQEGGPRRGEGLAVRRAAPLVHPFWLWTI